MKFIRRKILFFQLVLALYFVIYTAIYLPHYFKKDLYSFDESIQSVVSANLYRDFWNPSVRLNSLYDEYQGWTEGPEWQHIPALFAYVPLPFFWLDGGVSIEMKRLSYVFIAYLMFAFLTYYFSSYLRNSLLSIAAVSTAVIWTNSPFVKGLLQGGYFGFSDVVLAFTITITVLCIIHFLIFKKHEFYSLNEVSMLFYGFVFALPLITKNALGGMPAFIFLFLLLITYKGFNRYIFYFLTGVFLITGSFYGIQWYKNPEVFQQEFLFSIAHFGDVEGWARPWHYFITNYFPKFYIPVVFIPFAILIVLTSVYFYIKRGFFNINERKVLTLFGLYALAHWTIICFVTSKSPNYLLQSFHLLIFFVVFILLSALKQYSHHNFLNEIFHSNQINKGLQVLLVITMLLLVYRFQSERRNPSLPANPLFTLSEEIQSKINPGLEDIFITYTKKNNDSTALGNDYWLRYYILFITGSESRTMQEFKNYKPKEKLSTKYKRFYIITHISNEVEEGWNKELESGMFVVWSSLLDNIIL